MRKKKIIFWRFKFKTAYAETSVYTWYMVLGISISFPSTFRMMVIVNGLRLMLIWLLNDEQCSMSQVHIRTWWALFSLVPSMVYSDWIFFLDATLIFRTIQCKGFFIFCYLQEPRGVNSSCKLREFFFKIFEIFVMLKIV